MASGTGPFFQSHCSQMGDVSLDKTRQIGATIRRIHLLHMEAMYEEEDSIYESLKRSEKFNKVLHIRCVSTLKFSQTGATLKGSLILDWEGPNLDKSGMDYSSVELNSRGSLHEASKDHKSARNSTQGAPLKSCR